MTSSRLGSWRAGVVAVDTTVASKFGGAVMVVTFVRVLHSDWRELIPRAADLTWFVRKARAYRPRRRRMPAA